MRSVWLCSRNDVIGNIADMLAALGVFGTGTGSSSRGSPPSDLFVRIVDGIQDKHKSRLASAIDWW